MIDSCQQCTTNCCQHGPGPHKIVKMQTYLDNFEDPKGYNQRCEHLGNDGKCGIWNTPKLPEECRTFVCHIRKFSKKELKRISQVHDYDCPECGRKWSVRLGGKYFRQMCEACGAEWRWKMEMI